MLFESQLSSHSFRSPFDQDSLDFIFQLPDCGGIPEKWIAFISLLRSGRCEFMAAAALIVQSAAQQLINHLKFIGLVMNCSAPSLIAFTAKSMVP